MNDDTITRARAAVARLREAEGAATPGPWVAGWNGDPDTEGLDAAGPVHIIAVNRGGVADLAPNPYGDANTWERAVANASAITSLRNAAPALLCLAEAVGRLAEEGGAGEWWYYRAPGWSDPTPSCIGCGELDWRAGELNAGHGRDCPALAIDAALADLAALAGDADAGEVTP